MSLSSIDKTVLNTIVNNKFSSAAIISVFTNIPQNDVENSVRNLSTKRLIYQSVGGLPKRFSSTEELYNC